MRDTQYNRESYVLVNQIMEDFYDKKMQKYIKKSWKTHAKDEATRKKLWDDLFEIMCRVADSNDSYIEQSGKAIEKVTGELTNLESLNNVDTKELTKN